MDLPQEFQDHQRQSDRLERFDAGLDAILQEALGKDWLLAKQEDEDRLLTQRQRDWRELRYFYEASIVNSADLFSYLSIIYTRPEIFQEIKAVKTLAAAEELRPFHDAYTQLATEEEKNDYWHQTRQQREPIEGLAEDMSEFADLLIQHAERHPSDFPEVEARNPFDRVSELVGSLRRKADEAGNDTRELDTAANLFEHLRNSLSGEKGDSNRTKHTGEQDVDLNT
jgi:hypothetical protein